MIHGRSAIRCDPLLVVCWLCAREMTAVTLWARDRRSSENPLYRFWWEFLLKYVIVHLNLSISSQSDPLILILSNNISVYKRANPNFKKTSKIAPLSLKFWDVMDISVRWRYLSKKNSNFLFLTWFFNVFYQKKVLFRQSHLLRMRIKKVQMNIMDCPMIVLYGNNMTLIVLARQVLFFLVRVTPISHFYDGNS